MFISLKEHCENMFTWLANNRTADGSIKNLLSSPALFIVLLWFHYNIQLLSHMMNNKQDSLIVWLTHTKSS